MRSAREVVITGMGVVSPIGIGNEPFWDSLCAGRSGVRALSELNGIGPPVSLGANVPDFQPLRFVRPRKALKVMSRDIQLAFAAAELASCDAKLDAQAVEPERLGVVFGADMIAVDPAELADVYRKCVVDGQFDFGRWGDRAMSEIYPLWLLKYLPNMPACHVSIARDARGPNNSLTLGEVSSLAAICEAVDVIQRGQADVMIAGGSGSRTGPVVWARREVSQVSSRYDDPAAACRPFDADRDGMVQGEGAGAFVLEARQHAEARGVKILARVLGHASRFEPRHRNRPPQGSAICGAITAVLSIAGLRAGQIGHVNAHGMSTVEDDRVEAIAIRAALGNVPVTAPKGHFGSLGAGSGAVEMAVSVLAFRRKAIPPTLNYRRSDPACPVNVIHGGPCPLGAPIALVHNQSQVGQSVAILLSGEV